MNLNALLMSCAERVLDVGDYCGIDDVVACAHQQHPEVFDEHAEQLVFQAARRMAKDILRRMVEEDGAAEQRLPGLGLPVALAVRRETGQVKYVRTDKAVWSDLQAARDERALNVARAEARLEHFDEVMDRVRAQMEHDPSCTLAEALRRERRAA